MAIVSYKPAGRLGNALFQCAATIAYALKNGIEYSIPAVTNSAKWNPVYLQHLVNSKWIYEKEDITLHERTYFKYEEIDWMESWRGKKILLEGYWQNEKYFIDHREAVLDAFDFFYTKQVNLVGVHVRRGDYVTLREKHPDVPVEWYENAMSLFKDFAFMIFSDDIEWCKKVFAHRNDCIYSEDKSELDDLISFSHCEHQINSASTFSWWGSYLNKNKNKQCIFPKTWLTPSHSNPWTEEIVLKEWTRI
jgi:hypothetical protein